MLPLHRYWDADGPCTRSSAPRHPPARDLEWALVPLILASAAVVVSLVSLGVSLWRML